MAGSEVLPVPLCHIIFAEDSIINVERYVRVLALTDGTIQIRVSILGKIDEWIMVLHNPKKFKGYHLQLIIRAILREHSICATMYNRCAAPWCLSPRYHQASAPNAVVNLSEIFFQGNEPQLQSPLKWQPTNRDRSATGFTAQACSRNLSTSSTDTA